MTPHVVNRTDGIVFILGAGASYTHGLPVMSQFLGTARRRLFDNYRGDQRFDNAAAAMDSLLQFHKECRTSAWLFNRDWDNIEELYTQADLCRIAKIPNAAVSKELCESIAWAIWDIYRTDNETNSELARVVSAIRASQLCPKFITTNYDVVIERCLGNHPDPSHRHPIYYPGFDSPGDLYSGEFVRYDESIGVGRRNAAIDPLGVPVIKLHGSVNWFAATPDCYAFFDASLTRHPAASRANESTISNRLKCREDMVASLMASENYRGTSSHTITPSIIPPMLGKSSNDPVIEFQWNAAINTLRNAREVWIIGYSFPPTDTFMPRLLSEGLYKNSDLEFVAIANVESREQFEGRLQSIFNPINFGSRLHYFQIECHKLLHELGGVSVWHSQSRQAAATAARNWARDKRMLEG